MEPVGYGVCRLAVVPVRSEGKHKAEQRTQLLFGDHYEILNFSDDKNWARIRIHSDGTEGWLDAHQHHEISKEYFDQINQTDYKITTEIASSVLYKKSPLTIVMGSIVPVSSSELFKIEEQFAFNGESKSLGQRRDAEFLIGVAKKYISSPYQWGGKSPFGIDAPGFVQMVFRIAGYSLQRDVKQQATQGKKIKSYAEAVVGDVAFFTDKDGQLSHVGIILDDERLIHAYGHVRVDKITDEGALNPETKVYSHLLHSIRRVIN